MLKVFVEDKKIQRGIEKISEYFPVKLCESGIKITVHNSDELKISYKNGVCDIYCRETSHFFRALGHLIENGGEKDFEIAEQPQFDSSGAMFDLSRNSVLTTKTLEKTFCKMALMGHNFAFMYMENTYEVDNNPYFGYMRGRYSKKALKKIDDFAFDLGIEVIPCIQTLSHLESLLRWEEYFKVKDTETTILVEEEKSYKLIEEMISTVSGCFRTKKIHIGMDEAKTMGRGKYLNTHEYKPLEELMKVHLSMVNDICKKYGLNPILWSDMFVRPFNNGSYNDAKNPLPEKARDMIPDGIKLVYWDYYYDTKEHYEFQLGEHKKLDENMMFAGGFWSFAGNLPKFQMTEATSIPALEACKAKNVREVCICAWQDNGSETNFEYSYFGMALYAEIAFSKEFDKEAFKKRVKFFTGVSYEDHMLIDELGSSPTDRANWYEYTNPAKYILYQDVLMGLFDKHVEGCKHKEQYARMNEIFANKKLTTDAEKHFFEYPMALSKVLEKKCEIGLELKKAYDDKNKELMRKFADTTLKELYDDVENLRKAHRKQWHETSEPFGFDVLDIRYGGVLARIDTAIYRINEHLEKGISIRELEEERLFFGSRKNPDVSDATFTYFYSKIASAGILCV